MGATAWHAVLIAVNSQLVADAATYCFKAPSRTGLQESTVQLYSKPRSLHSLAPF